MSKEMFRYALPVEAGLPRKTVRAGSAVFGGDDLVLIAGPCTVESRDQMMEIACAVKEAGATMLRGGLFKPRTSPYSFQGLLEKGYEIFDEVRARTGLPIVSEVMDIEHIASLSQHADMLQIGARNMQNYSLLKAAGACCAPIFLKRGMAATVNEFLLAAEYILAGGNENLVLCERGLRTFESATRYTFDINAVALLRQKTWLPVIGDSSHGTGQASLVGPVGLAAIAAGADGLMTEVHWDPAEALCDGDESLTPEQYHEMVKTAREIARAVGRTLP